MAKFAWSPCRSSTSTLLCNHVFFAKPWKLSDSVTTNSEDRCICYWQHEHVGCSVRPGQPSRYSLASDSVNGCLSEQSLAIEGGLRPRGTQTILQPHAGPQPTPVLGFFKPRACLHNIVSNHLHSIYRQHRAWQHCFSDCYLAPLGGRIQSGSHQSRQDAHLDSRLQHDASLSSAIKAMHDAWVWHTISLAVIETSSMLLCTLLSEFY